MTSRRTSERSSRCHGFTLVEMVTSLAILGIILLACGSATVMATRAGGDAATRAAAQLQAADAAGQIVDDLNVAIDFTQRTATSVTFTVPDRLNDGSPQTVKYSWTGIIDTPLLRQFNNGPATPILTGVRGLDFGFTTRTVGPEPGPTQRLLFSRATIGGSAKDYTVSGAQWVSQTFSPSLPLGTPSYTLTRVRLSMKSSLVDGLWDMSIRRPDPFGRPTATVVAEKTVYGSAMSTDLEWIDIPFDLSGLNPLQSLCVVLRPVGGTAAIGVVRTDQSLFNILSNGTWASNGSPNSSWTTSDWSATGTVCALMEVYGTVP